MRGESWRELWVESRHRAEIVAVDADARGDVVFSHLSAACVLGLPLYRVRPRRVHVAVGATDRCSGRDVFRHEGDLDAAEIIEVDGLLCTVPDRTVVDVARTACAEVALSCADAALAVAGGDPRAFDDRAASELHARIAARTLSKGARGIRQARVIAEIADGRAQLPLESVTRLQLHRLGFARPRLQVPAPAPDGGTYWVDMMLDDAGVLLECDGDAKYLDDDLRATRTIDRVILDEKRREDWLRGVTRRPLLRVTSTDAASPESLAALLRAHGVQIPRRPHHLIPSRPVGYGA